MMFSLIQNVQPCGLAEQKRNYSVFGKLRKSMLKGNLSNRTERTEPSSFSEEDVIPIESSPGGNHSSGEFLHLIEEDEIVSFSLLSIESSQDGSEESLPEGMPSEIVVIEDSVTARTEMLDTHKRLKIAESLVESYKAKMQSTEHLADSFSRYLRKTQGVADDLLAERNGLLATIQEMEQEEASSSNEQGSLLKMIICFSLFVYMCGGSEFYLVASVGFYLFADFINACI